MQDNPSALLDRLNARERQVLELTVGGSTLGEMAALMGVSGKSIWSS